MLYQLKKNIRKLTPEFILGYYHLVLAKLASTLYGKPSKKMFVIGVTGTKGKTSTANFIWSVLNSAGFKAGQIGTANIRIGEKECLNKYHMTMPGPFVLQKLLRRMVETGCTHVVMEVTSEGIKLSRHVGIIFDAVVFTNLSPEHLTSHGGSFEKYKQTKQKLFAALMNNAKRLQEKYVKRIIIVNKDDSHALDFLNFPSDIKKTFGINQSADLMAKNILSSPNGVDFMAGEASYHLNILGEFNVYNALPAILLGQTLQIPTEKIQAGISNLKLIEGRMQKIDAGQKFTVIVDYAHEKVSMNAVLDAARGIALNQNLIVLLGAEGGGRDKQKRTDMGIAAAKKADYVICSNVDPYDDDPKEIVEDIAKVCEANGKVRNQNLFVIEDRQQGIAKAINLAQAGDIVVITGKGAEQSIIINGKNIPWDDRRVVIEELRKIKQN